MESVSGKLIKSSFFFYFVGSDDGSCRVFFDCSEQEAAERSVSFALPTVADQTNGGNDTEHQAHEHQAGSSNTKGEEKRYLVKGKM